MENSLVPIRLIKPQSGNKFINFWISMIWKKGPDVLTKSWALEPQPGHWQVQIKDSDQSVLLSF